MSNDGDHLVQLKQSIAELYANFEESATKAWNEVLSQLEVVTKSIAAEGPTYIPQVSFNDLEKLKEEDVAIIKRKGSVLIKDVVDDGEAASWKRDLQEFVKANPTCEGVPLENKQFFQLFWTKSQVEARSHPNVLSATTWLNKLYHTSSTNDAKDIDFSTPLTYADRFRIRQPGIQWGAHPPHVDGGSIERWEDPRFRACFEKILKGDWKSYDAFDVTGRLGARTTMYGRPNQASIFRTFQGWLALSETAPTEGTLRVFPDVLLGTAYIILRPFFTCRVSLDSSDALAAENWKFDLSTPDFPGINTSDSGNAGGKRPFGLSPESHPHLLLDSSMTSVPKVNPGDMVFWHCDVIHSVEQEHTGKGDSSVMYIPAVPLAPQNEEYIKRQVKNFIEGIPPPDFPRGKTEIEFVGVGRPEDITNPLGRKAMGLPVDVK